MKCLSFAKKIANGNFLVDDKHLIDSKHLALIKIVGFLYSDRNTIYSDLEIYILSL